MIVGGSVSQLIAEAKVGDEAALAKLHQRYWPALVGIAVGKLKGATIRDRDAEDVAQTAFISFYETLKCERVPHLTNRHQLLALLTHIVACKAVNEIKHAVTQKEGGGKVRNASPIVMLAEQDGHSPLEGLILKDCYEFYIGKLPAKLRPFAELHLAGFTNAEIAQRMNCVRRTVDRKLAVLRMRWQQLASDSLNRDVNELLDHGA